MYEQVCTLSSLENRVFPKTGSIYMYAQPNTTSRTEMYQYVQSLSTQQYSKRIDEFRLNHEYYDMHNKN